MGDQNSRTRHLSFSLGLEEFAIPLLTVREVIGMPEITPVPHTSSHFLGVMNLRGQVISIIDLRKKLGIKPLNGAETAVVICDLTTCSLGVVVDSINSVLASSPDEISERPEIDSAKPSTYIAGIYRKEKKLILFLDIIKTLDAEELQRVSNAKAAA